MMVGIRKMAFGAALALVPLAAPIVAASPASAATVPEWDHVENWVSGSGMKGDVYWSSYRSGSGTVRIYNDMSDRQCTVLKYRTRVNGVWSGWIYSPSICTVSSYNVPVSVNRSSNIEYWQFVVYEAETGASASDTNQPGGY